jgi:hypothetical protein
VGGSEQAGDIDGCLLGRIVPHFLRTHENLLSRGEDLLTRRPSENRHSQYRVRYAQVAGLAGASWTVGPGGARGVKPRVGSDCQRLADAASWRATDSRSAPGIHPFVVDGPTSATCFADTTSPGAPHCAQIHGPASDPSSMQCDPRPPVRPSARPPVRPSAGRGIVDLVSTVSAQPVSPVVLHLHHRARMCVCARLCPPRGEPVGALPGTGPQR